jgi:hypothetical protein
LAKLAEIFPLRSRPAQAARKYISENRSKPHGLWKDGPGRSAMRPPSDR